MTEARAKKIIETLKSKYNGETLKIKLYEYALKYSYTGSSYIGKIFMNEINTIFF